MRDHDGRGRIALAAIVAVEVVATVVMRLRGYPMGGNVVVRCQRGHLYTTIWIPGASLKSLRFGWWRLQWCPVGHHVSIVRPVKASRLSEGELEAAGHSKDIRIP